MSGRVAPAGQPAEPLVGRGRELRRLRQLLAGDGPRAIVVCGPPGAGKSRLLTEAARTAAESGWSVERVFASPSVRSIPLGAISHLLVEVPGGDAPASFHGSIAALRRRRRDRGLLLVVDDCHDLDDGSAAFVRQLVVHGDATALLSQRLGAAPPAAVTALWKDGGGDRLDLGPLNRAESDRLVEQALGGPAAPSLLDEVWRLTEGHPLYLLSGLRAARDQGSIERRAGTWYPAGRFLTAALEELVLARTQGLAPAAVRALELVAVGGPVPLRRLEFLAGAEAVAEITERGLAAVAVSEIGSVVAAAHPLYAEVVAPGLPPERRRSHLLDLAGATLGEERLPPVGRLRAAVWVLEADSVPPHDLAVEAAGEAMRRIDYRLAERLARAALAERPGSVPALLALARALVFQGRAEEADEVLSTARPEGGAEVAEVALARGHALAFGRGRPAEASAVLLRSAALVGGAERARLDAERSLYAAVSGDFGAVFDAAGAALANPDTPEVVRLSAHVNLGLACSMTARLDGFDERIDEAFRLARRHGTTLPLACDQLGLNQMMAWVAAGRLADAEALARRRVEEADSAGAPNPLWLAGHGHAAGARGMFDLAIASQRRALSLFESGDPLRLRPQSVALLALHQAQARRLPPEAGGRLEAAAEESAGEPRLEVWVGRARAWAAAAAGALDRAAERAAATGRSAVERDHISWGVAALHDAVRLGRPTAVAGLIGDAVAPTSGARLLEAMRDHAGALDAGDAVALGSTARSLSACGSPLLAAEASAQEARLHDVRKDEAMCARALLRAEVWRRRCAWAATPALDRLPAGLTQRELQVVEHAARDLTSREIAAELYVSVRTVDNHLHAAYRKLAVSGREEIGALLAEIE